LFFFNFYIKLNLIDIIFEGEKVVFITRRNKYIFEVKQCSKIIVKARYYIFEFKEIKLVLMVKKSCLEKKNIEDFRYFKSAKYINKNI
jgi:hypothetical protein